MPEAPKSSARAFYESIRDSEDQVAAIESLVNEEKPTFEEVWLEFKRATAEDKDNAKKWSEVATAFANTAGGVLIWGIGTEKKPRPGYSKTIDCASGLHPVERPLELREALKSRTLEIAEPYISGIEYLPVEKPEGEGRGYLVCYVPESRNRPHKAQLVERQPYLIRVGDSTVSPHPSLLRLMFFPQLRANLRLNVFGVAVASEKQKRDPDTQIFFELVNDGPATYASGVIRLSLVSVEGYPIEISWVGMAGSPGGESHPVRLSHSLHPGTSQRILRLITREPTKIDAVFKIFGQDFDPVVFEWRADKAWFSPSSLKTTFGRTELPARPLSDYEAEMESR